MSSLFPPKQTVLDTNGDPVSGAEIYFYEAGTSTPLDTWSDEARTSANANPIVADGDGRFGPVYGDPAELYKIRYEDGAGNLLYEVDNVAPVELASNSTATRLAQVASNPIDQGAVGDGAADESTEVQAAIDAATGVVDLLGKTFRCDSQINLPSGITIRNGTLDFSNNAGSQGVAAIGGLNQLKNLSSDASIGDRTIDVSDANGLFSGELVGIFSDDARSGSDTLGEMNRIQSIAGTTITLEHPLSHAYTVSNSARLMTYDSRSRIGIENLRIINKASHDAIVIQRAERIHVKDVVIEGDGDGILCSNSYDVRVEGLSVSGATAERQAIYLILGSRFFTARDLVLTDNFEIDIGENGSGGFWVTHDVSLFNVSTHGEAATALVRISENADTVHLENVRCREINWAGTRVSISNCRVVTDIDEDTSDPVTETLNSYSPQNYVRVDGCVVGGGIDAEIVNNSEAGGDVDCAEAYGVVAASGDIDVSRQAVGCRAQTITGSGAQVTNISGCYAESIYVDKGVATTNPPISITGNTINGTAATGIEVEGGVLGENYTVVSGNSIECATQIGIQTTNMRRAVISGNVIFKTTGANSAIVYDGTNDAGDSAAVIGNVCVNSGSATGTGISETGAGVGAHLLAKGNVVLGFATAIQTTAGGYDTSSDNLS